MSKTPPHPSSLAKRVETAELPSQPSVDALGFHYQPIFGRDLSRPAMFEALVRWTLPDGTIRGPADFLPYFFESGDDERLELFTRFTIEVAGRALKQHPGVPGLSVNLSPAQLCLPVTVDALKNIPLPHRQRIQVEITEDAVPYMPAYRAGVWRLHALGVRIVLDDVTPEQFEQRWHDTLPFAGVKLDRSMLPRLLGETSESETVRFVSDLRLPKFVITAEGIQDAGLIPYLEDLGVTRFQGFALGRPGPKLWAPEEAVGVAVYNPAYLAL